MSLPYALSRRGTAPSRQPFAVRARATRWTVLFFLPALMWVALWFSINTGPWVLARGPVGLVQWLHALRAFFPEAILLLSLWYIAASPRRSAGPFLPVSLKLWTVYGLLALFSSTLSASPGYAAYWALAYLAALAALAALLQRSDPLEGAACANHLSWLVATAFLLTLVVLARDALFANAYSGYAVSARQCKVLDMSMSRSTGLARFAAVPAIVGLGFALSGRGMGRLLGGLIFTVSFAAFIYYLQARASIFGFAGAAVVVMVLTGVRGRLLLLGIALAAVGALFLHGLPPEIWAHVTRGHTSWEELSDMSGRKYLWRAGFEVFLGSPLIGMGFWGDRLMGGGEAHNTWVAVLIYGGVLGAGAFLAGLARAWWDLWHAFRSGAARRPGQQRLLAQAGGLLAFFTLRGIAEQCGSFFNVDLMVMLPAIAYINLLEKLPKEAFSQLNGPERR